MSCVINNYSHVPRTEIGSVLIIGLGPLGGIHAIAAAEMGVPLVVGVDPSASEIAGVLGIEEKDVLLVMDAVRSEFFGLQHAAPDAQVQVVDEDADLAPCFHGMCLSLQLGTPEQDRADSARAPRVSNQFIMRGGTIKRRREEISGLAS